MCRACAESLSSSTREPGTHLFLWSHALTFFEWLRHQTERDDAVGTIARYAVKDKIFPQSARKLNIFLLRYEYQPEQREQIKIAHREWRRLKVVSE